MADQELLAQAVAEGMNLKASGVSGGRNAPEMQERVTGEVQAPSPANDDKPTSLADDLKQFASSPDGKALAQSGTLEKPMDGMAGGFGQKSPDTQALMADLKAYGSRGGAQERPPAPDQDVEQKPKR